MIDNKRWDIVIKSNSKTWAVNWSELWRYRDLIMLFVKRDLTSVYKQTLLGPLWFILQPVLTTLTFTIVFSIIARMSTNGIPPLLFYMSGIVPWTFFAQSLIKTSNTFIANNAIFSKVYFPRLTVPIAVIISTFFTFLVQFTLILLVYSYHYFFPNSEYAFSMQWSSMLLLPLMFLVMGMMGLSCGIIVSALTTRYRDLAFLVGFGVQLLMFLSPVIFPLDRVEGAMRYVILANPMTPLIETFRNALFGTGAINWFYIGYSLLVTLFLFMIGTYLFNKVDKTFTDTV